MGSTTRKLSARWRNCFLYELSLTGQVKAPGWAMQVDKDRLVAAIDGVMRRRSLSGTERRLGSAAAALFTVCEDGLSVRCGEGRSDIAAMGIWASPICADGFMVLRVLGRLDGDRVDLTFREGRMGLNERSVRAREI
jgi:hypothetical protein